MDPATASSESTPLSRADGDRVLVLAPYGRDALLIAQALRDVGIHTLSCQDTTHLCDQLVEHGSAGAVIVAEEAVTLRGFDQFFNALTRQPAWSELPLLLLTRPAGASIRAKPQHLTRLHDAVINFTTIERPLSRLSLITSVQAALRARRRQYEIRDMLQVQQQALRQRDEFLAMLGHELRNPIAAIDMTLALLDRLEWSPPSVTHHKAVVVRQVAHLRRLVDDLLDVARITSGRVSVRSEELNLSEIAGRVCTSLQPAFHRKGVVLVAPQAIPQMSVRGDAVRLEQVLANILGNALKFTPPGGQVSVDLARDVSDAVVRVRDTGRGIPSEKIEEIFDLFAQAHASIDRSAGGLGLGLYLARKIIGLHGGTIVADSNGPGEGATFIIRLPIITPVDPLPEGTSDVSRSDGRHARHNVLVVEDSADVRQAICMLLTLRGHRVSSAGTGLEGLHLARSTRPTVALLDIGLPEMDGFELARHIRTELGNRVLLVAMTGYGQEEDRARSRAAGFDHHLVKPVDMAELERLVASVRLPGNPAP